VTAARLIRLTRVNLGRDWRGAVFSGFGVSFGVGALLFFVALGAGASGAVTRIFPVDLASVEVTPPRFSLSAALGGGKLDDDAVARLKALSGVREAHPKMELRVPAMGSPSRTLVEQFHVPPYLWIAVIAIGVDSQFVSADLASGVTFSDPGPSDQPGLLASKAVPGIAARRLLELYNKSFAPAQGLQPIGEEVIRTAGGVELLTITTGRSMRGPTGLPERHCGAAFGGFSDRAPIHGVLVPIDFVRRVNREYGVDATTYSSVTLLLDEASSLPGVTAKVKEMGFSVEDSDRSIAQKVGLAVWLGTLALGLFSALICVLAAANIAHALSASVRNRSRELGVFRALGATRGDIAALVLAEAACIGAGGGAFGGAVARFLALGVDFAAKRWLPDFPFRPESFFRFPAWLVGVALAVGIIAAIAGAYSPARRAARMDPARAIAG
jgi:putative ABC transport system permease protein